ncbi:hypothetical protein Cme02nite_05830 [Catellatospora methionotrophica]|uniref:Uncharacterized protein n=1 Tax=Catellatospora methionotrophica TaxID=121620 RepID=A0A8J3PEK2_9ACTN|nr:hypothetical protein [Catellatospora methionotrophica]GIG12251.1 hypothetical protein Cme02nite_05830 [Catellatospora methionotrophica]
MQARANHHRLSRAALATGLALSSLAVSQLALAGPAAAVPGLTRQSSTGPSDSVAKTQNRACPAGTVALGGGGAVTGATGNIGLDFMLPVSGDTTWSVTGREDENGTASNWSLSATVLCAPAPSGYQVVSGSSAWSSPSTKSHLVSCPIGKVALGVGGAVSGASTSELILEDLRIDTSSVTVTGAEDGTGFAADWQVQARAICANQPAGYERLLDDSVLSSTSVKSVTVTCSAGRRVHGVGAEILGGEGQVRLTAVHAVSTTAVTATATEDDNGFSGNWKVRAFAVCAN